MGKKATFLAVALVAVALLFTGCPGNQAAENSIRVVVFDRGTDGGRTSPVDNNWTRWIQERVYADLGLEVIFVPVSRWDEPAVQVMMMAAGNPPDLMMTWNSDNVTIWGDQGGLFNMAPYVNTYLRDVRSFLGADQALPGRDFIMRHENRRTGELFSVPMMRANNARINVFMRGDWLDHLGIPVPTTHEEFYNALVAFRDAPSLPGIPPGGRVIPWGMARDVRWQAGRIIESFIDPTLSVRDRWVNIVADRHLLVPGYMEGVRFVNRMYNSGLIDQDFFLPPDDGELNRLVASGQVGAFGHNWDQVFRGAEGLTTNLQQIVPGARWVAVDAFPSADGVTHKISYDSAGLHIFIPAAARNPHGAMQYLNWLAKFENFQFLQQGPQGIVHDLYEGLPRVRPAGELGLWIQNSAWNIDLTPLQNGMFFRNPEDTVRMIALGYAYPSANVTQAFNAAMVNARPDPVIATAQPLIAAGPRSPELQAQAEALLIDAVRTSPANFDQVWNDGIREWLNAGAQVILDERIANFVAP